MSHPTATVLLQAWRPAGGGHPGQCVATVAACPQHLLTARHRAERYAPFVGSGPAPPAGTICGHTWTVEAPTPATTRVAS